MTHGSQIDPPNRFERIHFEADAPDAAGDDDCFSPRGNRPIVYLEDEAQSIVVQNDSPDIRFRYSVNPYRGCVHGCAYCYARNTHEYLGFSAGLDFETKILVKRRAPSLLQEFLARAAWAAEPIMFSGVTDCYQPVERRLRLTRGCLEVATGCGQPIGIVTKNALVTRDVDLLGPMARRRQAVVSISITTLDGALARAMEPRTSTPEARLRAVRTLADAGVPVRVMVAPLIPGLNDHEAPAILRAARAAGATDARNVLLRLPHTVEPVFFEWLRRTFPDRAGKIEGRVRSARGGKLYDAAFGRRMTGTGPIAEGIQQMFELVRRRQGFSDLPPLDASRFRPPVAAGGQRTLF